MLFSKMTVMRWNWRVKLTSANKLGNAATRKNHFYQSSRQTSTNNAKRKAMWTTTEPFFYDF